MSQSWEARVCAEVLRYGFPRKDEKTRQRWKEELRTMGRPVYRPPFWIPFKNRPARRTFLGMPVYMMKPSADEAGEAWPAFGEIRRQLDAMRTKAAVWPVQETTILYLHGGAYVKEFLAFHWLFMDKLVRQLGVTVIAPDYPLAPESCCEESLPKVLKLYMRYRKAHPEKKLYVAGDSAGGGMVLALAMRLRDMGLPSPDGLILLSPWVDVTLSHPEIPVYAMKDPMIRVEETREYGTWWAGSLDERDPAVSPIYGGMQDLPKTLIFTGTDEALYPDVRDCAEKLEEAGTPVQLVTGASMNHVYPVYPIPEAGLAFEILTAWLMRGDEITDES